MQHPLFLESIDERGVARLTLTRTEVHNAFNDQFIAEMTTVLRGFEEDQRVRVVALAAEGTSFSAGADLNWMRAMASYGEAENLQDAEALAELLRTLNFLSKPTIALVQGPAFGGGVGLVCACDIAIASEEASFALTEVKLGLVPSVISPYVIAAIGQRAARRYLLTAEKFSAETAYYLGLVHRVVPPHALESAGDDLIETLLKNGPQAVSECKDLIFAVAERPASDEVIADTARRIARVRVSPEGQEGLTAFLDKRKPNWQGPAND
ncbi:enoyl-CoA hydratase/isomerase family protein [Algihabitans albus]|uniref:enoyl-CoA hydratase/isomerase family protein n=1 Tax=Algihabitans albus TaxID=2164067 RepID=UPI000E5D0C45|nr:enoyl-CoA hydratase/isomerase family protein [Algihabitans albus]